MPIMISPAAMAKLGHPLGEVNLTKAAGTHGIIQIVRIPNMKQRARNACSNICLQVSANASCDLNEIFEAKQEGQHVFYQVRHAQFTSRPARSLGCLGIPQ